MSGLFPRVSEPQIIARDAEKVFESLLSSGLWNDVKVPQERDFGLDYRVESIADGNLKGCEFYVQVKGFSHIPKAPAVPISVSTSTVRYWRNKILPILLVAIDCQRRLGYFAWFDRSTELPQEQKTCTIRIPTDFELTDSRLQRSLEPYYSDFGAAFLEARRNTFYRKLFSDSVLMMHMLLQTNNNLLFAKGGPADERRRYLTHYFSVLSVFLHDVQLYRLGVDFTGNPIDESLAAQLQQIQVLHQRMHHGAAPQGSQTTFIVDEDSLYGSLPSMCAIFSEITLFFRKRFLG